ncbi:DUF6994 family protein [Treponema sp. UBA3813]|uniref:DUF6994 family protein n=1 Tax=Treponema sp. UBA3813 TaxID=1947715 RepID=UPI0025DFB5B8|nr:hypothetical protein [Treponema sp. UBA3813]
MSENFNKKNAINLLKDFIHDYLNDDIEKLKDFSFWGIAGNSKYDGTSSGIDDKNFDGDRTNIIYAIDFLLYGNGRLSEDFLIPNYPYRTTLYCNYTGETINTFNTLFGKEIKKRNEVAKIFPQDIWEKIIDAKQKNNPFAKDFFHIYQRLGNFMLLPSKTKSRKSINSYRGFFNEHWKDYFDIFLDNLKLKSDDFLNQLVDKNKFFFKEKSFDDFLNVFYLQGKDFSYKNFKLGKEHFAHWELTKENSREYVNFANAYIEKASELIEARSKILVNELVERFSELNN